MDAKKQADGQLTHEIAEGTKRLHLSVTRMKKLRSRVQAGGVVIEQAPKSTGADSWV
jgi:hypothetical protein